MISQALQELMAQSDQLFFCDGPRQCRYGFNRYCLGIRRIAEIDGKEC